jgi:hypothetical protein
VQTDGAATTGTGPTMASDEKYRDADGDPISLERLCRTEPDWACTTIRRLRSALAKAEAERDQWESDAMMARKEIVRLGGKYRPFILEEESKP